MRIVMYRNLRLLAFAPLLLAASEAAAKDEDRRAIGTPFVG